MYMNLQANQTLSKLTLSTLNSSKSAYASFTLHKSFFLTYAFGSASTNADGPFTCAILSKVSIPGFGLRLTCIIYLRRAFCLSSNAALSILVAEIQLLIGAAFTFKSTRTGPSAALSYK